MNPVVKVAELTEDVKQGLTVLLLAACFAQPVWDSDRLGEALREAALPQGQAAWPPRSSVRRLLPSRFRSQGGTVAHWPG